MCGKADAVRWLVAGLAITRLALGRCTWFGQETGADFTWAPASGTAPLLIDFSPDVAEDVVSYAWGSGDGSTSNERAPSRIYCAPGKYTVRLSVVDEDGHLAVGGRIDCVEAIRVSFSARRRNLWIACAGYSTALLSSSQYYPPLEAGGRPSVGRVAVLWRAQSDRSAGGLTWNGS